LPPNVAAHLTDVRDCAAASASDRTIGTWIPTLVPALAGADPPARSNPACNAVRCKCDGGGIGPGACAGVGARACARSAGVCAWLPATVEWIDEWNAASASRARTSDATFFRAAIYPREY
jgi:hypothetical protein